MRNQNLSKTDVFGMFIVHNSFGFAGLVNLKLSLVLLPGSLRLSKSAEFRNFPFKLIG
jgi:hypothetical protein